MQFARINDVTLHYQLLGSPQAGQMLVFVNSLGTDFRIWRDVVVRLAGDCPILLYDKRGHGLSDVGETPYSMELLADDLAALLDHVGASRTIVCGVSVGGIIAQQLYRSRPDLVAALILCDTAGKMGDADSWNSRIAAIEAGGMAAVADMVLARWFTPDFRQAGNADFGGYRNMLLRQPPDGYIATCAALREADLRQAARLIAVPTLCVVGDQDASAPPDMVADLARSIPGARYEIIAGCGHIPSVEQPVAMTEIMRAFLALVGTENASHVTQ